ncbi:hypothetical protein WSM22_39290 [Cytophagales bacterium WSM2-2]|nr:hypothetical protein WSM22_39290 [Cytophagales bacterium WSM2-2]
MFVFCTSCKERNKNSKPQDVTASHLPNSIPVAGEKYVIDKKESVVTWKCGGHTGYVYISKGELLIDKSQLAGGTAEVDMNTIADERYGSDNGLVKHLKSSDFFDVKIFPISTFAITKVAPADGENITVTGYLMIKGIANTVSFPAKIEVKDGIVTANGKLPIDRTNWDIRYKSGKFLGTLANEVIADDIEFDIKIIAKK